MSEKEKCKECGNKEIYQDNLCFKCFGEQLFSGLGEKSKEQQLQEEIERLHSIIKEVREYIENNSLYEQDYDYDYEENMVEYPPSDEQARKDILEILDKESDNK